MIEFLVNVAGPALGGIVGIWLVLEARRSMRAHNAEIERSWRGGSEKKSDE